MKLVEVIEDNLEESLFSISLLYEWGFNEGIGKEDVEKHIKEGRIFLVFKDCEVKALLRVKVIEDPSIYKVPSVFYISGIISKEKGYGSLLMNYALFLASKTHVKKVYLAPYEDSLIPFYKKFGFKDFRPNSENFPTVLMTKDNDFTDKFCYHYSSNKFEFLKSRAQIDGVYPDDSNNTISMFLGRIPISTINAFKKEGFTPWNMKDVYEHRISIYENIDKFIGHLWLESTFPNEEFGKKHWNKDMGRCIARGKTGNKEEFKRCKKIYMSKRLKYMREKGLLVFPLEFYSSRIIEKILDGYKASLGRNLNFGSKNQYATYIPHIYTPINAPLIVSSVKKL